MGSTTTSKKESKKITISGNIGKFGPDFRKKLKGIEAVVALKELNDENAAEDFLSEGGEISHISSVLQHADQADIHIVFTALTHVIKKYSVRVDTSECEEVCHSILTTYASSIHQIFNTNKAVVFKLFSALVPISFLIAKTIILNFDKCLFVDRKENHLRKEFLDLVDTLLNDENIFIVRSVLEKHIVNKVISGLMHDKCTFIVRILDTINEKVIKNPQINKTLKMQTFNTSALNFLFGLYHWKGKEDECEKVRLSAHALLLNLCTDYKKGIVFFDETYGTSSHRHNPLIYNFLRKVESPWNDTLASELIIKLLHTCPDLVKPIFDIYEKSFEPRASSNFYEICKFLSNFISNFNIVDNLSNSIFLMNIVKIKLFPVSILKIIKSGSSEKQDIPVRNACFNLCLVILKKLCSVLDIIKKKFPDFIQSVSDYIQFELPPLQALLKLWPSDNSEVVADQLMVLADVLLAYSSVFETNFHIDKSLNLFHQNVMDNPSLYVKAMQIHAIVFEPTIVDLDLQKSILYVLTHSVQDLKIVFNVLLKSTHLFDGFEHELNIWFYVLSNTEESKKKDMASAFLSALMNMTNMQNSIQSYDTEDVTVDLSLYNLTHEHDMPFCPVPNMTTCLPALLQHCQSQAKIEAFITESIVYLLHIQSCTKTFYSIVKQFIKLPKSKGNSISTYLKSWSKGHIEQVPANTFAQDSYEYQLSRIILEESLEENNLEKMSNLDFYIERLSRKKKVYRNILNLTRMAFFYASQCSEDHVIRNGTQAFIKLSNLLSKEEKAVIVKEALINPTLVQDLTNDVVENAKHMQLTDLLLQLISLCDDESFILPYQKFLYPKLCKLLTNEVKVNNKSILDLVHQMGICSGDAQSLLTTMLKEKPSKFYNKKKVKLTFWGNLLKYLIGVSKPELTGESITQLENILVEMVDTGIDTTDFQDSLVNYLTYHPYCVQFVNVDVLIDKISSPLTVTLLSIKPDVVNLLPKPQDVLEALPVVNTIIQKNLAELGKKYLSRVFKLLEKSLVEIILTSNSSLNTYVKEIEYLFDHFASENSTRVIYDHLSAKKLTVDERNCLILLLVHTKANEHDTFLCQLISLFNKLDEEDRENSSWLHENLIKCTKENSEIFNSTMLWNDFVKTCLKDSLSNEVGISLHTLTSMCNVLSPEVHSNIFKMVISHSKFVQIMLTDSELKGDVVKLLNICIKGGNITLSSSHVPLFLSAYNATLSHTDQRLLDILQHYEAQNISMHEYKPFLWGGSAATYYSVSEAAISKTLNRQPHPSQVTSLLLDQPLKKTITEFPVDRRISQLDNLFENEPRKYDPAFLLPLFVFLLAPESPVQLNKFINSGALAIALASLSSEDVDIREAAYLVLVRFKSHLGGLKQEQGGLMEHFIDVIRNGIIQLVDEVEDTNPQLSNIVSIFLAKASLIISNPSHQLYSTLHMYFLAKPAMDLTKVPEFFVLFHSEAEYNREWILTIIKEGLRKQQDWVLCDRTIVFKVILTFYSTRLSSETVQSIICDIINKCLCIDKGRFFMINSQRLLSWLLETDHPLSILQNLVKYQKTDAQGFLQTLLLQSLFKAKDKETAHSVLECLVDYLQNCGKHSEVLFNHLKQILNIIEKFLGSGSVRESRNLLKYSCQYVIPIEQMSLPTKMTFLILKQQSTKSGSSQVVEDPEH